MQDSRQNVDALQKLRGELAFINQGGYRSAIGWRCPLVFEDSPTCVKGLQAACPHKQCVLLKFVPRHSLHDAHPCRHIPLNPRGETLDMLYRTGTNEEIEECVRTWLQITITQLEKSSRGPRSHAASSIAA